MPPTDRRLIEDWLPIQEISVEAIRERAAASALPPINWLHVWWARRPLLPCRAAVAAALLKADADHNAFYNLIGTHPGVVAEQERLDIAKQTGAKLDVAYSQKRAFTHNPTPAETAWFQANLAVSNPLVLDVTAGGGSIPFEAGRLGLPAIAHELNPVATLILKATCQWPQQHGNALRAEYREVSARFQARVRELLHGVYPEVEPLREDEIPEKFFSRIVRHHRDVWASLWCRTIECPACKRELPLSPNWRLDAKGSGIKLLADPPSQNCQFQIVTAAPDQSPGTVGKGIATCPWPDCGATTPKGYLSQAAQAGRMGHRLYCVIYRDRYWLKNKSGKESARPQTIRNFKAPRPVDGDLTPIHARLKELQPAWDTRNILPNEPVPEGNDSSPHNYGMTFWRDMFNSRQLLAHGCCVQAFQELVAADKAAGKLTEIRRIAWCYIAVALDKLISTNSLLCRWHSTRSVVAGSFDTHDLGVKLSYSEMTISIRGLGLEWAVDSVAECIAALTGMVGYPSPDSGPAANGKSKSQEGMLSPAPPPLAENPAATAAQVVNGDAQYLDLADNSVDAVIFDPPYHNNVNYAELSDFFYVWLKRTAGYVDPEGFHEHLTDKVNEAIASPARFKHLPGSAGKQATADYQAKMERIFAEAHRVLKKERGIMVVMFTHKTTAAWNALTLGLIESGFNITRAWPVKTEAESSLAIRDKAAARSTILLVCRPIHPGQRRPLPWPQVTEQIRAAVRQDAHALQEMGLNIIDIYTAAYGTALKVISENWGSVRDTANPDPARADRPFAVEPADALEVARQEVAALRSEQITRGQGQSLAEPLTRFYILAWDGMGGPAMPFDEANLFARALGVELADPAVKGILDNRNGKVTLKSAVSRLNEGILSRQRPAATPLDQVHTAIAIAAAENAAAARQWLAFQGHSWTEGPFPAALTALRQLQKPGHPDEPGAQALYALLYGPEPAPRTAPLPVAE